jgi:hypothetical protein
MLRLLLGPSTCFLLSNLSRLKDLTVLNKVASSVLKFLVETKFGSEEYGVIFPVVPMSTAVER